MKTVRLNRRQFFQAGVFGAGKLVLPSAALSAVADAPSNDAHNQANEVRNLAMPQPTFTPIASTTNFGAPVDISMGWDGTLWAIDASGAPHVYDAVSQQWDVFGDGVDAAAINGQTAYVFRGAQFVTVNTATNETSAPQDIASTWPTLPDSFKLGVSGAVFVRGKLYLLRGGWYVPADGSAPRARLSTLPLWPTTAQWKDGLFDASIASDGIVWLFRGTQYITVDLDTTKASAPKPTSDWKNSIPNAWIDGKFDTGFLSQTTITYTIFSGPAISINATKPRFVAPVFTSWPAAWHPILHQAPSGRMGTTNSLWSIAKATTGAPYGQVCAFTDDGWQVFAGMTASSLSCGQDGTAVHFDPLAAVLKRWDGAAWSLLASVPATLQQVSVGDAAHVWARDAVGTIYSVSTSGVLTPNMQTGPATHIAANADGTVWHCNSANPSVYRLVSEATAPSAMTPVKSGLVTSVEKVASTGFGNAYCLTRHSDGSTNMYRYDSPYVFKTSKSYITGISLEKGLGLLFLADNTNAAGGQGVALDAHTGAEVARSPRIANSRLSDFVFDPIHDLVYAGFGPFVAGSGGTGGVVAFDARTMQVLWTFSTGAEVDTRPALNGTQLAFADSDWAIYMIDTHDAYNRSRANLVPQLVWQTEAVVPPAPGDGIVVEITLACTPLIALGRVYAQYWLFFSNNNSLAMLQVVDAVDGSAISKDIGKFQTGVSPDDVRGVAPVLGTFALQQSTSSGNQTVRVPAVWMNSGVKIQVVIEPADLPVGVAMPSTTPEYLLPAGNAISGLTWDNGSRENSGLSVSGAPATPSVWFGDTLGHLWGLTDAMVPMSHTPYLDGAGIMYSTPVIYKDAQGGATVLYSVVATSISGGKQVLTGFDPETGLSAAVASGATSIYALSRNATNGVVYAGGSSSVPNQVPQVFGIRVDTLAQTLRDFIIESQMIQDPDENAPGGNPTDANNPIPPSRARYQTHLTIVDDAKNPMPNEPVKIWADVPVTILVDGTSYNIGPADSQFALLKTGVDGALIVSTGYSLADGSDAPDIFATPLRVWAAFMNPFERVVIAPDAEFHTRVTTAHANAADDDPDKVNLVTATTYTSTPSTLFTTAEQSDGQPANCAQAIAQMKTGVGFGSSGTPTTAARAAPPKYMAYTDLPGANYFATNIPTARPTAVQTPTGIVFTHLDGTPTTAATMSVVSAADALAAIDALPAPTTNPPWQTAGTRTIARTDESALVKFWAWLKAAAKKVAIAVTHVVVAIADAVTVGIRLLVDGVEKVFKAIVKVVDDIASAVGSFFKAVGKAIDDVVSALSVVFNFREIIWTHKWLAWQFHERITDVVDGMQTYVQPAIDKTFTGLDSQISSYFDRLRADLQANSGNPQINNTKGMGQTPHSTFNVGPQGGTPSSHATQCTWGTQKLKSGTTSATTSSSTLLQRHQPNKTDSDPVADFFTAFVARLTGNGDLAGAVTQLKTDFGNLFHASSAKQFFSTFVVTLLDIVETLVLGALAVVQALVDGILAIIEDAIQAVLAVLDYQIQIPVLTWLYEKLFGEPLTLLNLITLVAAIPVTIVFRVVEGQYPSQANLPTSSSMHAERTQAVPHLVFMVFGVFTGVIQLVQGAADAACDAWGDDAPPAAGKVSLACGGIITAFTFPLLNNDISDVSVSDWALYGTEVISEIIWLIVELKASPSTQLESFLTCTIGLLDLVLGIMTYIDDGASGGVANAEFAAEVIGDIIAILNPIKLAGPEVAPIVSVVDVVGGIVLMFISIITAIEANDSAEPTVQRMFLPWIPHRSIVP